MKLIYYPRCLECHEVELDLESTTLYILVNKTPNIRELSAVKAMKEGAPTPIPTGHFPSGRGLEKCFFFLIQPFGL